MRRCGGAEGPALGEVGLIDVAVGDEVLGGADDGRVMVGRRRFEEGGGSEGEMRGGGQGVEKGGGGSGIVAECDGRVEAADGIVQEVMAIEGKAQEGPWGGGIGPGGADGFEAVSEVIGEESEPADEGVGSGGAEIEGIEGGLEGGERRERGRQSEAVVGGQVCGAAWVDFEGHQWVGGEDGVGGAGGGMEEGHFGRGMGVGDGGEQIEQRRAGPWRKEGERQVHAGMMEAAVINDKWRDGAGVCGSGRGAGMGGRGRAGVVAIPRVSIMRKGISTAFWDFSA